MIISAAKKCLKQGNCDNGCSNGRVKLQCIVIHGEMLSRLLCSGVEREGVKARPDWLPCFSAMYHYTKILMCWRHTTKDENGYFQRIRDGINFGMASFTIWTTFPQTVVLLLRRGASSLIASSNCLAPVSVASSSGFE